MSITKKILLAVIGIIILIIIVEFINAAKYAMAVNVVEGANVIGVNPLTDKLDFGDLSRNNGMTRYVDLANSGSIPTQIVVLKTGEIADLVTTDRDNFTLNPGQNIKLAFEIHIPDSAPAKKYSGYAMIFRLPKFF